MRSAIFKFLQKATKLKIRELKSESNFCHLNVVYQLFFFSTNLVRFLDKFPFIGRMNEFSENIWDSVHHLLGQMAYNMRVTIDPAEFRKTLGDFWAENKKQDAKQFAKFDLFYFLSLFLFFSS